MNNMWIINIKVAQHNCIVASTETDFLVCLHIYLFLRRMLWCNLVSLIQFAKTAVDCGCTHMQTSGLQRRDSRTQTFASSSDAFKSFGGQSQSGVQEA